MVEGNLQGGYELGIETAVKLAESLVAKQQRVELIIAGQVNDDLRLKWNGRTKIDIQWAGVIANDRLPELYQSANLLFSGDLNAACPNSVIEALACGLPVLAFDTGALKELVPSTAGRVVNYGGDPWKLDPPDTASLVQGAREILADQTALSAGARAHAMDNFSLDKMVDAYIEALSG
jgi:glycosyltransferase involved in cell wall biosynthesis